MYCILFFVNGPLSLTQLLLRYFSEQSADGPGVRDLPYQTILLTGAPASGKSTLAGLLSARMNPLQVFNFGHLIHQFKKRKEPRLTYEELRQSSASLITYNVVKSVDAYLVREVRKLRSRSNVLISRRNT